MRITGNRPIATGNAAALDAVCIELDSGGAAHFGRQYRLDANRRLPQTLSVLPGKAMGGQVVLYASDHDIAAARLRRDLVFHDGAVGDVGLALDVCTPAPSSGRFVAAAPAGGAVAALMLTPQPTRVADGDVALAWAPGSATRFAVAAAGAQPLMGGVAAAPAGVHALAAADLDGDCRPDAVFAGDGATSLWRDNGDGSFAALAELPGGRAVAVGDLDAQPGADVVVVGGPSARLFVNDGSGHFREDPSAFDHPPGDATAVAIGDLDGDGLADVVIGQGAAKGDLTRVYLNDPMAPGHFTLVDGALPPLPLRASALALADADRDGDLDLVIGTVGGGGPAVRLYLNRGDAFLEDRTFVRLPADNGGDVAGLYFGDVDHDCLADLVVARAGAAPLLWRSGGDRLAAAPLDVSAAVRGVVADDVDGDGRPDLVLWGDAGLVLERQQP